MKTAVYVLIFLLENASSAIAQTVQPDQVRGQTNYYPLTDSSRNISQILPQIEAEISDS